MTGQRASEKLYYLDVTVKIQENCLTAISRPLSISVWHQRLGHSNHQNILKMFKLNVTNGLNLENNNLPLSPCPQLAGVFGPLSGNYFFPIR